MLKGYAYYYSLISKGSKAMLKKMILSAGLLTAAVNGFAATPNMSWKLKTVEPLNQITFGITVNAAAAKDEFYFANQFGFTGGGNIGYTGIQPTVNSSTGERQFKVLFSSFRDDSHSTFKNCSSGADGAKGGVTCRMLVPGSLGDTFLFRVQKTGNLLTGTAVNNTTGREDVIGQWTVSSAAGSLATSQISWIENYLMNGASYKLTCDSKGWPYYEVKFLPPTGNNGTAKGTISNLSRGSDACPGAIQSTNDDTGTLVQGGY